MHVDPEANVAKLEKKLALCQRELAQLRLQLEEEAERATENVRAVEKLREVSTRLTERLDRAESMAGWRGRIKRRLLSSMPRSEEDAELAVLRGSKLMDGAWYLRRYPAVVSSGLSPALHYLRRGAAELKDPGPMFSTRKYVEQNPSIPAGVNPLAHFHATHRGTTP